MNEVQEARDASLRLVRLLGGEPETIVPKRHGFLEEARAAAKRNDENEVATQEAREAPYWEADSHDAAYWRRVLQGKVSESTLRELLRGMGLE